jgi:hypothetical protein
LSGFGVLALRAGAWFLPSFAVSSWIDCLDNEHFPVNQSSEFGAISSRYWACDRSFIARNQQAARQGASWDGLPAGAEIGLAGR